MMTKLATLECVNTGPNCHHYCSFSM